MYEPVSNGGVCVGDGVNGGGVGVIITTTATAAAATKYPIGFYVSEQKQNQMSGECEEANDENVAGGGGGGGGGGGTATVTVTSNVTPTITTGPSRLTNARGMGDNCIDIEHINVDGSPRPKQRQIGTQTSEVVPYRLRFWPRQTLTNVKCIENGPGAIARCCLKTLSQWFLSQIGLTFILLLWALLGAFTFYKTEGPHELEQSIQLERMKREISVDLSTSLRQSAEHLEAWPSIIGKHLQQHEELLLKSLSTGYGEGGHGKIWTYPGCVLFAVSLLTTLGFGAPVPKTSLARGAAVLFSAIGIPLHFLLILNMGNLAAGGLQGLASKRSAIDGVEKKCRWLKWFPFLSAGIYYTFGVLFFGVFRERSALDSLMFPLDFTATGGVADTSGHVRILYAVYLEGAVTLAAIVVSLLQAAASNGIIDLGLRLGLLTNT